MLRAIRSSRARAIAYGFEARRVHCELAAIVACIADLPKLKIALV